VDRYLRQLPEDTQKAREWLIGLCRDQGGREEIETMHWRSVAKLYMFIKAKHGDEPKGVIVTDFRAAAGEEVVPLPDSDVDNLCWSERRVTA
jgi:hypothetical protein